MALTNANSIARKNKLVVLNRGETCLREKTPVKIFNRSGINLLAGRLDSYLVWNVDVFKSQLTCAMYAMPNLRSEGIKRDVVQDRYAILKIKV